ncbi:MAG: carboxypeptidase regulatory-like domain-containing protein, partial [Methanosarcinaceae archaeon]|nr:carboxypeptidase regulatory-like domain-containing protein [Methanosarcinaceae archaeon]
MKAFKRDEAAMELPINIVVMLVVGMVALATLVSIIPEPTKEMSVSIEEAGLDRATLDDGNSIIVGATAAVIPFDITVKIKATDREGNPVRDASVVMRGLGGVASNRTDINGYSVLETSRGAKVRFSPNQNEGTLDLTVSA